MRKREEIWIKHLGIDPKFPREVAVSPSDNSFFRRDIVYNILEYVKYIQKNNFNNLFSSLYSKNQWEEGVFDKILIDLDGDLKDTYILMNILTLHYQNIYKQTPLVYFSGRGFHIILYFDDIIVNKQTIRNWTMSFIEESLKNNSEIKRIANIDDRVSVINGFLNLVDTSTIGDLRQVSRIPLTINYKGKLGSLKYCIPINPNWSIDDIRKYSTNPDLTPDIHIKTSNDIYNELSEIDKAVKEKDKYTQISFTDDNSMYQKEIIHILNYADNVKDGRKRILSFLIIPRLIFLGKTREEVHEICDIFLLLSGKGVDNYNTLIDNMYDRTKRDIWRPWKFSTFFERYPLLLEEFRRNDEKV